MSSKALCIIGFFISHSIWAFAIDIEEDTLFIKGQMNYDADFFRSRVLNNSYVSFLDNYADYSVVQNEVVGDFHTPDRQLISLQGNSYRWTQHYLEKHRIDSRVMVGSGLYTPNLYHYHLRTDLHQGGLYFESNETAPPNSIHLRYNFGQIGQMTPWTQFFINHATVSDRQYLPIEYRKHLVGQGSLWANFKLKHKGQSLDQQVYLDFGNRQLIGVDYTGEGSPYNEHYAKVEWLGELPFYGGGLFDKSYYALAISQRDQFQHEFYYNPDETADNNIYSFSLWGQNQSLNTGFNFSINSQKHKHKNFYRNYVDMDGESLFPFYPDALYYELSHHLSYHKRVRNLTLEYNGYNSIIHTNSDEYSAYNPIYFKSLVNPNTEEWLDESEAFYQSLYVYEWQAKSFTSGLLENSARLSYEKQSHEKLRWKASIALTLDAILLRKKSLLRPNWEADLGLHWKANSFFSTGLNLAHKRLPFHFDQISYLSNDYLNGKAYYWIDDNEDEIFQSDEKGELYSRHSGQYRQVEKGIAQPAYLMLEWPIILHINKRYRFTILSTYKKYYHMWQTELAATATSYGFYTSTEGKEVFFLNPNQELSYLINDHKPTALQQGQAMAFLSNTPFVFTNIIKFDYQGEAFFVSASFVSQAMISTSTIGNAINENNLEHFSDLEANPNSAYLQAGRPQQDRGYVSRLLVGYKYKDKFRSSFLLKFIDGQPFTHYDVALHSDEKGQTQVAQWNRTHKGAVPYNGTEWGSREDLIINTELRASYTFALKNSSLELNAGVYNLFDFRTELNEACFALPTSNGRIPIEVNIPRGMMLSAKVSF